MVEAFIGKWRLTENNSDEYMKAIGVNIVTRQMARTASSTTTISIIGDLITMKTDSPVKTSQINFQLGEEFDESTWDGRQVKSLVTLDENELVQIQKWDGKETSLVREVNGKSLTLTLTFGDVVATQLFEKV